MQLESSRSRRRPAVSRIRGASRTSSRCRRTTEPALADSSREALRLGPIAQNPAAEGLGRHRPREEVALRQVVADRAQLVLDPLRLDSLGDDLQPQGMGHLRGRLYDHAILRPRLEINDERLVELQRVHAQVASQMHVPRFQNHV